MSKAPTTRRGEAGSASIEAALGVPAFALMVGLVIFGGRTALAHQALESAATDAARSASLARSTADARSQAVRAATTSLSNQHVRCRTVGVSVDTRGFEAPLGQTATVTVTVTCRLDLADLALPGVPGTRTVRATMASPIDAWRERA
jgi:Flp pilus assembly protein TadG